MDDNICDGSREGCTQMADKAADAAVKKVFAILGVDIDVPKDVEEFRENLRFGASLRRAADRGSMAVVGAVAVTGLAALGAGIVNLIVKSH